MPEVTDRDLFEQAVDHLRVECPDHHVLMTGKRVEVKAPYGDYVIKVMYVGKCPEPGCRRWFEYLPPRAVLWP